ncbi:aldehyde ferredoxin oxidoreductase family protein [Halovivax gelatinilyticus]|uniref:aldehyde ferredoxin oxidoreductase family protein n=1 Tax=Halovivax gelatinilyticus TaxID=2961597 RepID=UPI0020CA96C4|nr:aldehyde ferredoxin oxidoreductase family protein [Halovivax gelatinilyticus]
MTDIGGFHDRVARIDLSTGDVAYESIDDEDARKYLGARGLGVKYVFEAGPDVDPLGPENPLVFMNGALTGTQVTMSGRIAVCTKSPLTGTVTDSHHGGWSGARLKWAGFDGLCFEGQADDPVYAYVEDGDVELRDASHLWGEGFHDARDALESEVGGTYGQDLSVMGIGPGAENEVRFGCIVNEDDRASGRGGTGCVMGSKNLKAVVVKATTDMPEPADPATFEEGHEQAMQAILESEITGPNEGGLSVYGTNVLMNITEEMDGLPTANARYTSTEAASEAYGVDLDAERVSGETVRGEILVDEPTCHSCPVACKKEVEVSYRHKGEEMNVRMESFEYEPAFSLGPNSMNDDKESIAVMIDRCNDLTIDAIETGNMLAMAMELTEADVLGGDDEYDVDGIDWGDDEAMIDVIEQIGRRDDVGDLLAEGASRVAERLDAGEHSLAVKGQTMPAYDPRCMKGMGIAYATSNRGACHLRAYTPAAEILGVPEKVDPYDWEGKGELTAAFQDLHAVSDSFDICKFNAFAEGIEEYVLQYNGMTGLDVTEDDLLKAGERIYTLERYYNNLAGFDGADDSLPARFLEGGTPGQGASEGEYCELEAMKREYYDHRGWVDGVVPDEKLAELEIDVGPGTGVSNGGSGEAVSDD